MELKEKQLELEKSQQKEEKWKTDAFFNVMLQQQQQQQLMMMLSQHSQVMIKMLEKMRMYNVFHLCLSVVHYVCSRTLTFCTFIF